MKIGNFEGTPEEITNFFVKNSSLNLSDYLEKPEQPLRPKWLVWPIAYIILILAALTLLPLSSGPKTFFFLLGCGGGIWLALALHVRFKIWATGLSFFGILLLMLVAAGFLQPGEMVQCLKAFNKKD